MFEELDWIYYAQYFNYFIFGRDYVQYLITWQLFLKFKIKLFENKIKRKLTFK